MLDSPVWISIIPPFPFVFAPSSFLNYKTLLENEKVLFILV